MYLLRLFGGLSIEGPNGVVTGKGARRHALALLALLATSRSRRLSRDKVMAYLWPESDASRARNLLNQTIHALRDILGQPTILSEGDDLALNPDAVSCDVWSFEEALVSGELKRAVDLYGGPFADGFFLPGALEFERWTDGERERLRRDYLKALEKLAEGAAARGDREGAVKWWRRLSSEEPANSKVMLRFMQALESVGDRARAIREAEAHTRMLREEFEAAPSPAVLALVERMRTAPTGPAPAVSSPEPRPGSEDRASSPYGGVQTPSLRQPVRRVALKRFWKRAAIVAVGLALVAAAAWAMINALGPAAHGPRRLAVLPLANLTGDPQQEYYVAGMHDVLVTELSQIAALTVISRQSTLRYRNSQLPLPAIARQLGVEVLVEGAVFLAGDSVRITVQLIRAEPEEHLWASTYQGSLRDALALQGQVARAIARAIDARMTPAVRTRLASSRSVDPEAQRAYLRGLYHLAQLANTAAMSDSLLLQTKRTAVAYLEEAVALDPEWAAAHAGLARAYQELVSVPVVGDLPADYFPKAKAAALRALELDDRQAQGHAALGLVHLYHEWDWAGAERELRRALELVPNSYNHGSYAAYLRAVGRYDEALVHYRKAEERNPLSEVLKLHVARTYSCTGRHRDALAKLEEVRALLGDDAAWLVRVWLGFEYLAQAKHAEALAELEAAVALSDSDATALDGLAYGYARAGRLDEASELADWLKDRPRHPSGASTLLIAALGETDRAVEKLQATVEASRSFVPHMRCSYTYRELQDDPRIQELVRRIGYPD